VQKSLFTAQKSFFDNSKASGLTVNPKLALQAQIPPKAGLRIKSEEILIRAQSLLFHLPGGVSLRVTTWSTQRDSVNRPLRGDPGFLRKILQPQDWRGILRFRVRMKLCMALGRFIAVCAELKPSLGLRNRKAALTRVNKASKHAARGGCCLIQHSNSCCDVGFSFSPAFLVTQSDLIPGRENHVMRYRDKGKPSCLNGPSLDKAL
jgi:hypothetical protein